MSDTASGSDRVSTPETATASQAAEFEGAIARLSRRLSGATTDELDDAIVAGLRDLGLFFGVQRVNLGRLRGGLVYCDHSWQQSGLRPEEVEFSPTFDPVEFRIVGRAITGETVAIRSPDEAPASSAERRYMEQTGLMATLFVPGMVAEEVVGLLVLDSFAEAKAWPDSLLRQLALPVDLLFGALLRLENAVQIRELSRFERLVGDLSASFVVVKADGVERTIEGCLEKLGEYLSAERAFLGRFSEDNQRLVVTNMWARESLSREAGRVGEDVASLVPWFAQQILQGEIIKAGPELSGLPEEGRELRDFLEREGISSGVVLPMMVEGKAFGMLGLDTTERPRDFPDEVVGRLRLMADVIGSSLRRTEAGIALTDSLAEVRRLKERLEHENIYLRQEIEAERGAHRIVGESPALLRVLDQARQVAETDSTVLITGETGTGKELLARLIQETSSRSERPLITVNCATLPPTLVESELFGRERGAYTGAMTRQAGRFELADGATIFLDEIGDLPVATQVKLLRVLESGEFERLGSSKTHHVDVRVLAATNHDLLAEVKEDRFREDLFYRLSVFPLTLPPLRERPGDVLLLTWAFVQEFSIAMRKAVEGISHDTISRLEAYSWPGNVRELRNVVERAMILSRSPILEVELPGPLTARLEEPADDTNLEAAQRRHILSVLERTSWQVSGRSGAAELLGMKPTTLYSRMKKLGIQRPA